jgi:hypothetical protein
MAIVLSLEQRIKLRKLWFIYGNNGAKHSHTNHRYIQNFLENAEDTEDFYNQPHTKEKISEDCLKEVKAIVYQN